MKRRPQSVHRLHMTAVLARQNASYAFECVAEAICVIKADLMRYGVKCMALLD